VAPIEWSLWRKAQVEWLQWEQHSHRQVKADRGRRVLVRGEVWPPQGVLRIGLVARAAVLCEAAQPVDRGSERTGHVVPVDRIERVLDQQS